MDRTTLLSFVRRHRLSVPASVSEAGAPQAAVVGFAELGQAALANLK